MPSDRYYLPIYPLEVGSFVTIQDTEWHHMIKVMRTHVGDKVELVNGQGQLAQAELTKAAKREGELKIQSVDSVEPPAYRQVLAQAIPRHKRLDTIIEKITELGVTDICLFPAVRSEKKELSRQQLDRIRTISISAMKQCGRLHLPRLQILPPLEKWELELFTNYSAYFGDIAPEAPHFMQAWKLDERGVVFFVGPEAGFHPKEESLLRERGAYGVKLHGNILRTDTAPLVAFSLISHWNL